MDVMQTHNRRLNPSVFDSDYYLLTRLRSSLVQLINRHLTNRESLVVFDYGCGDIPYRALFDKIGGAYVAGDIAGNPLATVVLDEDSHIPCADESFDVVLSIQVLEHVPNVKGYLAEARRVLKKNGLLILSTHGWWTHHPFPNDYWRWTREGLVKVVNDAMLDVVGSDWLIGMLAYSYQLRVQCWKGVLERRGVLGRSLLHLISFVYQKLMVIADKITPERIGKDNAAIYVMAIRKK